jgi:hypothetical protein
MTGVIATIPRLQFYTPAGAPLAGGKLYTYLAGTTTPATTYQDQGLTTQNENPILLDSTGSCSIWLDPAKSYKFVLKNAQGAIQPGWPIDNVSGAANVISLQPTLSAFAKLVVLAAAGGSALVGFAQSLAGTVQRTLADVLSDTISVKDFGLVGDNTTGNSSAITEMCTNLAVSNYEVVLPKGDYLIDSNVAIPTNLSLRFRAGARLVIPNGVTLTLNNAELLAGRQQIFSCIGTGKVIGTIRNELIFPEWWGAIADGLHPPTGSDFSERAAAAARNAPALQAALTFAGYSYSLNGLTSTLSLTYGYYVYDTTLSIPLSANVVGYGIGSALFFYSATGNALECVPPIGGNNTMLKDFFIAPLAGPTWNQSSGYGLYMKNVSTPIVDNVWSSGFGPGGSGGGTFYFENVIEGRVRGLISDNSNGPAYTIRGVCQGTIISNCINAGTKYGAAFDIQSGYDLTIIGCTGKGGYTGFTNGFYVNAWEDLNLIGCSTYRVNREGIVTTASTLNCNIANLTVNDASSDSPGTYAGMSISGSRNTLTAPKVTSNTPQYSYGIQLLGGATDCTVSNPNVTPGTVGAILDAQPTGTNTYPVRKVTTTTAAVTTIWQKSLNNNAGAYVEAAVNMKQRGATGETAVFKIWARAATGTSGTTITTGSIVSSKSNVSSTVNAAWVLSNSGANTGVVDLQITGLASGSAIDWSAIVTTASSTG